MKKSLCSLLIILYLIEVIHSQISYIPFAKSDKFWFYGISDGGEPAPKSIGAIVVWTNGDTIINNLSYVKLYKSGLEGSHPCQFPPCFVPDFPYVISKGDLIGFLRDDTLSRKVYYKKINLEWHDCIEEEIELYDFSETVDSIPNCLNSKISNFWGGNEIFGSFDSVTISNVYGKERSIFNFQGPYLFIGLPFITDMQIIEGIGSTFYNQFSQFENSYFINFCEGSFEDCNILQIEHSEFKVGDHWTYSDWLEGDCINRPLFNYSIVSDTLISNKVYSVLAAKENNIVIEESKVLLFKKNNKIAFYEKGIEYLLYDFNVRVGDTLEYYMPSNFEFYVYKNNFIEISEIPYSQKLIIFKIDSILSLENKIIKRFYTRYLYNDEKCVDFGIMYEGIGSSKGILGSYCWIVSLGCYGELHCFNSSELNFKSSDYYCNPELIEHSEFNGNEIWLFTPWDLKPTEKINRVKSGNKVLIENRICNEFYFYEGINFKQFSRLILFYKDSLVQFYDGTNFKTLYDFRQKNIGDTVKYYLPKNTSVYDISSTEGHFSPDTIVHAYKVVGIETIISDEGTGLKKYTIEDIYSDSVCYGMGRYIVEGIGGLEGFLGHPCFQLTGGFPEYFRCFKSDNLNYNALSKDCELTSTNELISEFKIFPNPTNNIFTINTGINYDNFSIIDLKGKIILNSNSVSNEIDVSEINNGVYILELRNKNQVLGKTKIVIVK